MQRNDTINIVQFVMTPQKFPQNLHTPKNIHFFWKPQKILKFKILNPKNDLSLRMYENIRVPSWAYVSVYLFVCLFVHPSVCPSVRAHEIGVIWQFIPSKKKLPSSVRLLVLSVYPCLNGPRREKTCLWWFANNKGADQPAHPRSLISAFSIRLLESIIWRLATSETSTF